MRHALATLIIFVSVIGLRPIASAQDAYAGLSAPEEAQVAEAIEAVERDGSRRAVVALRDRIGEGLSPALLDRAIAALVAIGRGPSSRVLLDLTRHRRVQVRAEVAAGLVITRAPNARRRLVEMLDDPSPLVRSAAAHAIGELGGAASMRDLVAAAALGNVEALAVVIAQARPPHVTRILREVDGPTLETYAPMLKAFAVGTRLPTRTRIAVLERLAGIGTGACHHLLQQIVDSLPEGDEVGTAAAEALGAVEAAEAEAQEAEEEEEETSAEGEGSS